MNSASAATPITASVSEASASETIPSYLRIEHTRHSPDIEVCAPVGEIDLFSVAMLERVLQETEDRRVPDVFVDLSGVTFLAVTGMRLLVAASARAAATDRRLAVVAAPRHVRRMLDITGASEQLVMYQHLTDALDALSAFVPDQAGR